jgi:hypothetical protein
MLSDKGDCLRGGHALFHGDVVLASDRMHSSRIFQACSRSTWRDLAHLASATP